MIVASGFVQVFNIWKTVRNDTSGKTRAEMAPFIAAGGRATQADR
jgi:hypothetical protein